MKIVVAPDKFKGSLSSREASAAIERGLRRALGRGPQIVCVPMADGGEGTVDAAIALGFEPVDAAATDPLGRHVRASFALRDRIAVIEMAAASGLARLPPHDYDATRASSAGTGMLVRAALERGARAIVVGVGGSASTDGGAGFLEALGARLIAYDGTELLSGGAALAGLDRIELGALEPRIRELRRFVLATDVDAPLLGDRGAAAVFGPQKGASPDEVRSLEAGLTRFADVTCRTLGRDPRDVPGAGAGGGFAYASLAYLGARVQSGFDLVARFGGFDRALAGATLCITGEGRIDAGTLQGKVVSGIAKRARRSGVPVVAFAGSVDAVAAEMLRTAGIAEIHAIARPELEPATALADAARHLEDAVAAFAAASPFAKRS